MFDIGLMLVYQNVKNISNIRAIKKKEAFGDTSFFIPEIKGYPTSDD